MISPWLEARMVKLGVESVPFAPGEDKDCRAARVAAHIGVSKSTVYNWQREEHNSRIGLNSLMRLLDLCPQPTRRHVLAKFCNSVGVSVEGIPEGAP